MSNVLRKHVAKVRKCKNIPILFSTVEAGEKLTLKT